MIFIFEYEIYLKRKRTKAILVLLEIDQIYTISEANHDSSVQFSVVKTIQI